MNNAGFLCLGPGGLEKKIHLLPFLFSDLGARVVAGAVGNYYLGRLLAVPAARDT